MRDTPISSRESAQTGALPALRATISDNHELEKWREILYQSMTSTHSNAISGFLGKDMGVAKMMEILNTRRDKTKKSKWSTLQAIIRYKKGSSEKDVMRAQDVRTELESIDRDFGSQKTVAGCEIPIIGSVRATITDLLQESQNTPDTPHTQMITVTNKSVENTETLPTQPIIPASPPPQTITEMIGELPSYEVLAVHILEHPEWMTLLHSLCQLHVKRKYGDFVEKWSAFKENEEDDLQIELWNILSECSQAKEAETKQTSHIISIAFEVCGYAFGPEDKELYTKRYTHKKRAPELWRDNDDYEKLLLDLEDIHTYHDLSLRTKNIFVSIPDKKEWYMYEEKICPMCSLDAYVGHELSKQFSSGAKKGQEFQYLREAKKIIRQLSRK